MDYNLLILNRKRFNQQTLFNSDRRFYRRLNDVGEYIEDTAEQEQVAEIQTVMELLDAAAVTKVWSYVCELIFNMLILVDAVKMADRVVREMMGL